MEEDNEHINHASLELQVKLDGCFTKADLREILQKMEEMSAVWIKAAEKSEEVKDAD